MGPGPALPSSSERPDGPAQTQPSLGSRMTLGPVHCFSYYTLLAVNFAELLICWPKSNDHN
jgi:hypothetical protein